jgi:hypothetical protein
VAKVREAMLEDQRRTIHDVCDVVKLSYGTCQRILSQELNMQLIAMKFVPTLLSSDQKAHYFELKEQTEYEPNFVSTIITGDESWIYGYNSETKQQSSQWKMPNSLLPKKA